MRNNKIMAILVLLVMVCMVGLASAEEYTPVTMKFGTASSENTLTAQTFMDWGNRLSEATDGQVKLDVYCSAVLGSNIEMIQGAQMGIIDVVVIQPSGLADMGAPCMNLLSLPYLFEDYEQYYSTLFGEVGQDLLEQVSENVQGLHGFSYLPDGGRCYFTNSKPITCIEDIKGMKLRIQPYAIDTATSKALDFPATPTAFSELYSALQTGVVDGAENPLSGIDGNKLYEVSKYITLDNHFYNIPTLVISEKTWNKVNPATQELLYSTWAESVEEFFVPQLKEYEAGLIQKYKDLGIEVIETLPDYDKWVEAVKPVWDEFGADFTDLIEKVQAS